MIKFICFVFVFFIVYCYGVICNNYDKPVSSGLSENISFIFLEKEKQCLLIEMYKTPVEPFVIDIEELVDFRHYDKRAEIKYHTLFSDIKIHETTLFCFNYEYYSLLRIKVKHTLDLLEWIIIDKPSEYSITDHTEDAYGNNENQRNFTL